MPTLRVQSGGLERDIPLARRITTIGRSAENDVALPDESLPATALHIHFDGRDFNAACHGGAEMLINGRRKVTAKLADGDRIRLGSTELSFSLRDAPAPAPGAPARSRSEAAREAMEAVVRFSQRLLAARDLPRLLDELLDAVLEVTHAEKGFLILLEDGQMVVRAARNLSKENIEDAVGRVSDSIVQQVASSRQPLIVADALHDDRWSAASSVVNLKVCSVMCAPILRAGEVLGVLYLGNDSVVSLFSEEDLEVLTVFAAQASLLVQNALLLHGLRRENDALRQAVEQQQFGALVGTGASMREVFRRIEKVAATDVPVLVTGEPGTGKELVAREIHRRSSRAAGPFVIVNCGAIPEAHLERELFGYARGAFEGATGAREGKLQAASGGTLLLGEVGALPPALQVRLLRALQEKTVTRIGDTRPEALDVRVVAATPEPLEPRVQSGEFREDLYYRLNVVHIPLPPLRDRGDDVLVLARFFLHRHAREYGSRARQFAPAAVAALRRYAWPGNIRELENRVKKAVVLCDRPLVGPEELELGPEALAPVLPLVQAKEAFQKRYINEVLERNGGNRTKTAKDLGVDPRTIFRHLEKQEAERRGLPPPPPPPGGEERPEDEGKEELP